MGHRKRIGDTLRPFASHGPHREQRENSIKKDLIKEMANHMYKQQVTGCIKTMVKHLELVGREIEYL